MATHAEGSNAAQPTHIRTHRKGSKMRYSFRQLAEFDQHDICHYMYETDATEFLREARATLEDNLYHRAAEYVPTHNPRLGEAVYNARTGLCFGLCAKFINKQWKSLAGECRGLSLEDARGEYNTVPENAEQYVNQSITNVEELLNCHGRDAKLHLGVLALQQAQRNYNYTGGIQEDTPAGIFSFALDASTVNQFPRHAIAIDCNKMPEAQYLVFDPNNGLYRVKVKKSPNEAAMKVHAAMLKVAKEFTYYINSKGGASQGVQYPNARDFLLRWNMGEVRERVETIRPLTVGPALHSSCQGYKIPYYRY